VSCSQVLETRRDALDSSIPAFELVKSQGGSCFGYGRRSSLLPLVVVAVKTHQKVILGKRLALGMKKAATGAAYIAEL